MHLASRSAVDELYAALFDVAPHVAGLPAMDLAAVLQRAVFAAVDELKQIGLSSPRVITVVLSFVSAAWPDGAVDAIGKVRAWCIQRYFDPRRSNPNDSPWFRAVIRASR